MTKVEVKKQMKVFKHKLVAIMKSEKNIVYQGDDDKFADAISHIYGCLGSLLDDIDSVIKS